MTKKVKSGKEIMDDFFNTLEEVKNIDENVAKMIGTLYKNNNLTDINVKNELQKLRERDVNKN